MKRAYGIGWLIALGLLAGSTTVAAQAWKPERGIEIIAPTTPGGSVDLSARLLQKIFQDAGLVKVPVTVVNKPGAGGALSLVYLNQHAGDAHILAINTPNIVANDLNGRSAVRYTDITPLANLADQYTCVAVRTESPLRTGRDFIERLRKDPSSLAVSTPTTLGSTNHLSFALIARAAGIDVKKLKAVILGSGADAATAVLGGHVDAHVGTTSSVIKLVEASKMRVLAIAAPRRIGAPYDATPTWTEVGFPVVLGTWRGVIAPRGLKPEQIAFWNDAIAKALATETWKQALRDNDWEPNYLDSAGTRKLLDAEYAKYRSILADLGLIKEK